MLSDEQKLAMAACGIPDYMHGAIVRYYDNGISPGSFLSAVIDNDLAGAFGKADETNKYCIRNYIMWFYNHAPSGTWGSPGSVDRYCNDFNKRRADAESFKASLPDNGD